jgi:hypothetical protein
MILSFQNAVSELSVLTISANVQCTDTAKGGNRSKWKKGVRWFDF